VVVIDERVAQFWGHESQVYGSLDGHVGGNISRRIVFPSPASCPLINCECELK